ncbi:MAG TPA: hypothetical protein VKA34_03995 [Balneolales bacterium]|nr:hypothetical protein [Balneolales bacterium]
MLDLTATDYTWFIMIGLFVGWVSHLIFSDYGINMRNNILVGIVSSFLGGIIFDLFDLGSPEAYALATSILFSFVFNMYYYPKNKDIFKEEEKHKLKF